MIYASLRMCMTSWCCYQVEDSMSFTADVVIHVTCWCVWEGHSTACSESLHDRSSSNVSAMGGVPNSLQVCHTPYNSTTSRPGLLAFGTGEGLL